MMVKTLSCLLLATLVLTACGVRVSSGDAENAITVFHERLNGGELGEIWNRADPEFREQTTRADFDALMGSIRSQLGKMTSGRNVSFKLRSGTSGNSAGVIRESEFEKGKGKETFHFRADTGVMLLVSYKIESDQLK